MKRVITTLLLLTISLHCFCWGFYAHRKINYYAIFLLPPEMLVLYKPNAEFLSEHSIDPDKRRYAVPEEGPRHYIDMDWYKDHSAEPLPREWNDALAKYPEDTLMQHGIVPWWIQSMLNRLTNAFREQNLSRILKLSAEIGHYIADAHVPLHTTSNHNGQYTNQKGIHAFWESRVPEMLADREWDFFMEKAAYIKNPGEFVWQRIFESAAAADTVLLFEKELSGTFPRDQKFSFEERNGITLRQYSSAFTRAYDNKLNGMVERRMRQSIYAVASFWYTAWVNAGQPDLTKFNNREFTQEDLREFETLNNAWKANSIKGRDHETPGP